MLDERDVSPFEGSAIPATVPSGPVGRSLAIPTADGVVLDADLAGPEPATTPAAAVVLCHPHPVYGGNRHAGVIDTLFAALPAHGITVVRFDFRGVGRSTGTHDGGRGERHDVVAAAGWLAERVDAPLVLAGWSFGADVALTVAVDVVTGWFGVAPVLGVIDPAAMVAAGDDRPVLLLVPEHDQFTPPAVAAERTAAWRRTEVRALTGTDHSLVGHQAEVVAALVAFATGPAGGATDGR